MVDCLTKPEEKSAVFRAILTGAQTKRQGMASRVASAPGVRPVRNPLGREPSPALAFELGLLWPLPYRTVSVNASGSLKRPELSSALAYSV